MLRSSNVQEEMVFWKHKQETMEKELEFWKHKCDEIEQEFEEFRQNSHMLERELETSLEQSEKANRELRTKNNRLHLENETLREKYERESQDLIAQINELQEESKHRHSREENYVKYIRELEQKNDDLERSLRATYVSLAEFESKLNSAIEQNALLESELVDKEELKTMVQRLKDETRDLKQEIQVKERELQPDNDKMTAAASRRCSSFRVSSVKNTQNNLDAKRLSSSNLDSPLLKPPTHVKSLSGGHSVMTTPTRISAMNIVGDLLRKVGALESKLANCRLSPEHSRDSVSDSDSDYIDDNIFDDDDGVEGDPESGGQLNDAYQSDVSGFESAVGTGGELSFSSKTSDNRRYLSLADQRMTSSSSSFVERVTSSPSLNNEARMSLSKSFKNEIKPSSVIRRSSSNNNNNDNSLLYRSCTSTLAAATTTLSYEPKSLNSFYYETKSTASTSDVKSLPPILTTFQTTLPSTSTPKQSELDAFDNRPYDDNRSIISGIEFVNDFVSFNSGLRSFSPSTSALPISPFNRTKSKLPVWRGNKKRSTTDSTIEMNTDNNSINVGRNKAERKEPDKVNRTLLSGEPNKFSSRNISVTTSNITTTEKSFEPNVSSSRIRNSLHNDRTRRNNVNSKIPTIGNNQISKNIPKNANFINRFGRYNNNNNNNNKSTADCIGCEIAANSEKRLSSTHNKSYPELAVSTDNDRGIPLRNNNNNNSNNSNNDIKEILYSGVIVNVDGLNGENKSLEIKQPDKNFVKNNRYRHDDNNNNNKKKKNNNNGKQIPELNCKQESSSSDGRNDEKKIVVQKTSSDDDSDKYSFVNPLFSSKTKSKRKLSYANNNNNNNNDNINNDNINNDNINNDNINNDNINNDNINNDNRNLMDNMEGKQCDKIVQDATTSPIDTSDKENYRPYVRKTNRIKHKSLSVADGNLTTIANDDNIRKNNNLTNCNEIDVINDITTCGNTVTGTEAVNNFVKTKNELTKFLEGKSSSAFMKNILTDKRNFPAPSSSSSSSFTSVNGTAQKVMLASRSSGIPRVVQNSHDYNCKKNSCSIFNRVDNKKESSTTVVLKQPASNSFYPNVNNNNNRDNNKNTRNCANNNVNAIDCSTSSPSVIKRSNNDRNKNAIKSNYYINKGCDRFRKKSNNENNANNHRNGFTDDNDNPRVIRKKCTTVDNTNTIIATINTTTSLNRNDNRSVTGRKHTPLNNRLTVDKEKEFASIADNRKVIRKKSTAVDKTIDKRNELNGDHDSTTILNKIIAIPTVTTTTSLSRNDNRSVTGRKYTPLNNRLTVDKEKEFASTIITATIPSTITTTVPVTTIASPNRRYTYVINTDVELIPELTVLKETVIGIEESSSSVKRKSSAANSKRFSNDNNFRLSRQPDVKFDLPSGDNIRDETRPSIKLNESSTSSFGKLKRENTFMTDRKNVTKIQLPSIV